MTDKLLPDIIQPESLQVAEAYLECGNDSKKTAAVLSLPIETIEAELKKNEVRTFINRRFNEFGFRNKNRIFGVMDQLISMKIEEMEESETGSGYDIMDMLKVYHKMKMDEIKAETDSIKAQQALAPGKQTNIQNNFGNMPGGDDQNYMKLVSVLSGGK